MIDVRPLLAVHLDVDEQIVHHARGCFVLEAFMRHDVAPVARGVADREQDRFVATLGFGESVGPPGPPVHGIVLVLQQIWTGRLGKPVFAGAVAVTSHAGHNGPCARSFKRNSRFACASIARQVMSSDSDTIFALSSGRPPAAIAVVRISGPRAGFALAQLTGGTPEPRRARYTEVRNPKTGESLDQGLALWFPAPRSETGEDVAELQVHGGRAVVAAILAALAELPGLRHAQPGEFTRRAFENGRMDLPAVEGLADLVAAETQAQRRQALRHLKGLLGARAETWRQRLIEALALVEAAIDFSDEEDVPRDSMARVLECTGSLIDEIAQAAKGRGERLREGLRIAIAGAPNAGKSTLFNRLARREAAIVSPFPGTTRDVLELHLDLGGFPVTVLDTAGIRETDDPVEREGVRRASEQAAQANLVLWVEDASILCPRSGESVGASEVSGRGKGLSRESDAK